MEVDVFMDRGGGLLEQREKGDGSLSPFKCVKTYALSTLLQGTMPAEKQVK